MQATERLWLTAARDRLVPEGHPDAATLYAAVGDEIPASAAERFGLSGGRLLGRADAPRKAPGGGPNDDESSGAPPDSGAPDEPPGKAAEQVPDKARRRDEDKAGGLKISKRPRG